MRQIVPKDFYLVAISKIRCIIKIDYYLLRQLGGITRIEAQFYLKNYKFKEWTKHQDGSDVTEKDKEQRAAEIAAQLCEHSLWLSHSSRITREMAWDTCRLKITHPEDIGLASALKRYWALMCFLLENSMTTKVFASSYDYTIFRSQAPQK